MSRWKVRTPEERAAEKYASEPCTICHGAGGWDEERGGLDGMPSSYTVAYWIDCICKQRRENREYLLKVWPELADAPEKSADLDIVSSLSQTTWVTASAASVGSELRAAVIARWRRRDVWQLVVYRDAELPALMHADRTARSFNDRDVERLNDNADLIVVLCGYSTGRNKGVEEALVDLIAARADRTTKALWIIDDPKRPLTTKPGEPLDIALKRINRVVWSET